MANLQHIGENRIRKEMKEAAARRRKSLLVFGLPICLVLSLIHAGIGLLSFVFLAIAYLQAGAKDSVKAAGVAGEDQTLAVLETLPNDYVLFNQLDLPDNRSSTGSRELDFVVVGPNGVFVVETKNLRGELVGAAGDEYWTLHKVGRGGTPYSKSVRNPVRQVRGQVAVLNKFLQSRNLNPWITGLVCLAANNDMEGISSPDVAVVTSEGLCNYLREFKMRKPVGDPSLIVNALNSLREEEIAA